MATKNDLIQSAISKVKNFAIQKAAQVASNPTLNRFAGELSNFNTLSSIKRIELPKPQVQNQVGQAAINLGMAIPESIVNIPRNYGVGIIRTGKEIGQSLRDKRPLNLQNLAGGVAPLAESLFDVGTMGGYSVGKGIVKEGGKQLVKSGVKQAIVKGALRGAGYGAAGGLTYGLDTQYGKEFSGKEVAGNVAAGALLGSVMGGSLSALGAFKQKVVQSLKRIDSKISDEKAAVIADRFTRDELGRFAGVQAKEPVFYGDLRESLGMPRDGLTIKQIKLGMGVKEITPEGRIELKAKLPTQPKGVGVSAPYPSSTGVRGMAEQTGRKPIQLELKANKGIVQPTEASPIQLAMGGKLPSGQAVSLAESIPQDPVQNIISALKEAKPLEKEQGRIYAKIRSQQAGAIAGIGKNIPGESGFHAQLGQLKGEMPKVSFESIRKQITQPDIDSLFNKVEQANITPFEKITAKSGLAKLLGAEGGAVPVQSELKLLNEIFPPEFMQAVLEKRPLMSKLFTMGEEVLNLPRAMMATADMSAPLRQGVFLIGRPKQWLPAFRDQFKYFFSERAYQGLADDIKARPTYQVMRESKLAITDMSPMLQSREEAFMSNLAEKIPGFGQVAKASNRAYSGFLNKLRADVFDDLYKTAQKQNLLGERPDLVGDIARFVNAATGRGGLGALEGAAPVLNGAFFSPRLMASRLNLLNPAFYVKLDPFVRKEALKSLLTFASTGISVLTLAGLSGAEVGTNPTSSDFGKIKIGNTRLDIWGGFQQYFRAAGQLITGKYTSSTTGKEYTLGEGYKPLTRLGILGRVVESKESPVVSFVSSLLTGQNSLGGKLDIPVEIMDRFIPMVASSFYDLYKEGGLKDVGLGLPSIFGVGAQTYGKQIPHFEQTPAGKYTIKLNPVGGLSEDIVAKVRGTSPSNIPESQWKDIVDVKTQEQQMKIEKDKMKQELLKKQESGLLNVPEVHAGDEAPAGSTYLLQLQKEMEKERAKINFEYSNDTVTTYGDTAWYKEDDSIKSLDLDFTLPELKTADNLLLAKEYIADYKGSLTKMKNNALKAFDLGIIDQGKVMEVLTTVDKIQTALKKPKQAKKPKQPKFIPIKFGKAKKISGLTKSKKLKLVRPKKFK